MNHPESHAPTLATSPAPAAPRPLTPPRLGMPGEVCARCAAPLAEDQRYCLECGLRRGEARVNYRELLTPEVLTPTGEGAGGSVAAAPASGRSREITPLHAAAALGLLLLAVLVGSVLGSDRSPAQAQQPIVLGAATTPASTPAAFTSDWGGEDGWTIELETLPKSSSTPAQVGEAKARATTTGAPAVGALDTDAFPSLDAGNYLIYSGVFSSRAEAKKALKDLQDSFPEARVVEVSTTAKDDAADDASSDEGSDALSELENASPDEFVEKSRQLPDEVGTKGDAPPVDNKAPDDGGNDSVTIE